MNLATEARAFREMPDSAYADLQNGRVTLEEAMSGPDYAETIARKNHEPWQFGQLTPMMLAYGAACAREGYALGYGASKGQAA